MRLDVHGHDLHALQSLKFRSRHQCGAHGIGCGERNCLALEIGDFFDWPVFADDHDASMRLVVPDERQIGAGLDTPHNEIGIDVDKIEFFSHVLLLKLVDLERRHELKRKAGLLFQFIDNSAYRWHRAFDAGTGE